jgi:hypothetical protein
MVVKADTKVGLRYSCQGGSKNTAPAWVSRQIQMRSYDMVVKAYPKVRLRHGCQGGSEIGATAWLSRRIRKWGWVLVVVNNDGRLRRQRKVAGNKDTCTDHFAPERAFGEPFLSKLEVEDSRRQLSRRCVRAAKDRRRACVLTRSDRT